MSGRSDADSNTDADSDADSNTDADSNADADSESGHLYSDFDDHGDEAGWFGGL